MLWETKSRFTKCGMLMFEAVVMLATLTAVTFGMVTIMTGSFSNLAAAKDASEAQQVGELVSSFVKQKDYDKMDELIAYAPTSNPTSMDKFLGDSELKRKYSFSIEQIGDEIDVGSLGSTDDLNSSDDEGAKVKIMKVAIYPQDNKNVELYSVEIPVVSTNSGTSGASNAGFPASADFSRQLSGVTTAPEDGFFFCILSTDKFMTTEIYINGNLVAHKETWGSHNGGDMSAYFSVNKGDTLTYSGRILSLVFIPLKK